jgi:hypothetical protein
MAVTLPTQVTAFSGVERYHHKRPSEIVTEIDQYLKRIEGTAPVSVQSEDSGYYVCSPLTPRKPICDSSRNIVQVQLVNPHKLPFAVVYLSSGINDIFPVDQNNPLFDLRGKYGEEVYFAMRGIESEKFKLEDLRGNLIILIVSEDRFKVHMIPKRSFTPELLKV